MECEEEVQICDICGDAGYDDELAICCHCNDSAEHIYCMATMLDSVPLQWVCERCELEEKGSAKKRIACTEPLPIEAVQNHATAIPFGCSDVSKAKNVVSMPKSSSQSGPNIPLRQDNQPELSSPSSPGRAGKGLPTIQTQTHVKDKSNSFLLPMPAINACFSMPREGAEVKAAGLSSSVSNIACKVSLQRSLNAAEKIELNSSKSLADRNLSCSKRVFSRSSSFPVKDDQPTFLLPSRPKDLKRSKSTVVRPSSTWTSSKSSKSDENPAFFKKEGYIKDLTHATHGRSIRGTSHMVESINLTSAAGPKVSSQAGKRKKQYARPARDSAYLQYHGCLSQSGKETDSQHSKGSRRCFKCDQVGHVAAQCKYSSSSSLRVHQVQKSPASFDKTTATKCSVLETLLSLQTGNELNRPKKSPQLKSQDSLPSFKLASNHTSGEEGLVTLGNMDMSHQLSPKVFESQSLNGKHRQEQLHSSKGRIGTDGPFQSHVKGLQQAQGVNAVDHQQLQRLSKPLSPSNPCNGVSSDELALREAGLAVDTFSEAYSEISAEPCAQILWSGCFSIFNTCLRAYNGMQAHASTKADRKVSEAVKSLPFELHLEELKRGVETDTWLRSLQNQPPTSSSIGVYFFPVDMECHDIWYKPLLDHLVANDLALRTSMDFFQLLIFPSHLLPEADQCWDDRQYLWGILRSAASTSSHTATLGETV